MTDYHDIEQFILSRGCDFCYDAEQQLHVIYPDLELLQQGIVRRYISKPVHGLMQVAILLRGYV